MLASALSVLLENLIPSFNTLNLLPAKHVPVTKLSALEVQKLVLNLDIGE